jgi:hypothetical protein
METKMSRSTPKNFKFKPKLLKNNKIKTLIAILTGLIVLIGFGSYIGVKAYQNKKISEAVNIVNNLYQKNDALLAEGVTDTHIIRAGKVVDGIRDKGRKEELKFRVTAARTMWNTTAMVNNLYESDGQIALPKGPLDSNEVKRAGEALEDMRNRYKKELLYAILKYRLDDAVLIDNIRLESEKLMENNEENQSIYDGLIAKLKQIKNPELQKHYLKELNERAQPLGIQIVETLTEPPAPSPEATEPAPEAIYEPEEEVVEEPQEPVVEDVPEPVEDEPEEPGGDETGETGGEDEEPGGGETEEPGGGE